MIEFDIKTIGSLICSILLWTFAFHFLIGAIKREIYFADRPKKIGLAAIIYGLGYFLLLAVLGSFPVFMFMDYGYGNIELSSLSAIVLVVSLILGILHERYIKVNYLPIYDLNQAVMVTYQHLSSGLKSSLTKDDIKLILDLEFEYLQKIGLVGNIGEQKSKPVIKIDGQDQDMFITSKVREKGKNYTLGQIAEVLKAEEIYLKQIGALSNKENNSINEQKPKQYSPAAQTALLGTGVWRIVIISIIIGVIIFGRSYIIIWFNNAFFIKESIFTEKIPFNATLDIVGYYDQLQYDYPKYTKGNHTKALTQVAFAQYFLEREEFDKVLVYIQKVMGKNDKHLPAYIIYGDYLLFYKDNTDKALEQYQIAESIDKNNPIVNARLGDLYYNYLQEKEKGIDYYNKALEINPKYGEVHGYFIGIYNEKKEYKKAIESYHKALRYGADKAFVYYNAALTYKAQDNLDEARTAINRSLDKNSKNVDAYIFKAELLKQEGNIEEAIWLMEKVIKDYPQSIDALNYLGSLMKK